MSVISDISTGYNKGVECVYLLHNDADEVIYIGRTRDLVGRLRAHRNDKPWWGEVARGWWYPAESAVQIRLLERESIARYQPKYNQNDVTPLPASPNALPEECAETLVYLEDSGVTALANQYMVRLRRAGWTLSAIGQPLGITRERVNQRVKKTPFDAEAEVPDPPRYVKPEKPKKSKPVRPQIPAEDVARLHELYALAKQCRGWTPEDSPIRAASVALAELMADLVTRGFYMHEIAKAVGITRPAVNFRLQRFGYVDKGAGASVKRYVGRPAPTQHALQDKCQKGHPMSGDNLYIVPKSGTRVCRECDRSRRAAYYLRRKARAAA